MRGVHHGEAGHVAGGGQRRDGVLLRARREQRDESLLTQPEEPLAVVTQAWNSTDEEEVEPVIFCYQDHQGRVHINLFLDQFVDCKGNTRCCFQALTWEASRAP